MTLMQVWLTRSAERRADPRLAALLAELTDGLAGDVLEVGCGAGGLFGRYPGAVRRVVAVEPSADLRAMAVESASRASVPVEVVDSAPGGDLPVADHSVDAVVCCDLLCSAGDPAAIVAEIRRVLRPGGEFRLLEHVVAPARGLRAAQRAADRLGWPRLMGGCHTARDTVATVEAGGFTWRSLRPLTYARSRSMTLVAPHVLGVATTTDNASDISFNS